MSGQPKRRVKAVASGLLWHAVLSSPPVEWQQLSAITRGVADEILRRLDHQNAIVCAPGRTTYEAVCHAIAAHPKERRRVNEAIDELVSARWATLGPDRFTAHFPDLGGDRPSADEARAKHTTSTQVDKPTDSLESDTGSRVEERRVEIEREETARDPMVWRATDLMLRGGFKKFGIVFADLVGPAWTRVVNWVLDFAPAIQKAILYVIECMAHGFFLNEKARQAGYPLSYVVTNPRQFYEAGVAASDGEVVFENEEAPF